jgi:hypothetical protein
MLLVRHCSSATYQRIRLRWTLRTDRCTPSGRGIGVADGRVATSRLLQYALISIPSGVARRSTRRLSTSPVDCVSVGRQWMTGASAVGWRCGIRAPVHGHSSVGMAGISLSTFYTNILCAAKRGDPHHARQPYVLLPARAATNKWLWCWCQCRRCCLRTAYPYCPRRNIDTKCLSPGWCRQSGSPRLRS